jgi:hypothetical protein
MQYVHENFSIRQGFCFPFVFKVRDMMLAAQRQIQVRQQELNFSVRILKRDFDLKISRFGFLDSIGRATTRPTSHRAQQSNRESDG